MAALFQIDWPYWTLTADGRLRSEDGDYLLAVDGLHSIHFGDRDDAEQYLEDWDIRGTVR